MKKNEKKTILENIYYCKLSELKLICCHFSLHPQGKKQDIIDQILSLLEIEREKKVDTEVIIKKKRKAKDTELIHPDHYTNGKKSRAIFKELIGDHFHFTSYGMNWIKECWKQNYYPSYQEFADYWKTEFERRKKGGAYASAQTNARVNFFRENKGKGHSQKKLNSLWQEKRAISAEKVFQILGLNFSQ